MSRENVELIQSLLPGPEVDLVALFNDDSASGFRAAQTRPERHISAGGVEKAVTFVDAEEGIEDAVDQAYRTKYGRYSSYVEPMVSADARATTLKLLPRGQEAR